MADASKKEFSEKQDMQDSRYVTKSITAFETESMAAFHGDDIIAEGEREKWDRLDEILKQLVVVKSALQKQAWSIRARMVSEGSDGGQQKARS